MNNTIVNDINNNELTRSISNKQFSSTIMECFEIKAQMNIKCRKRGLYA